MISFGSCLSLLLVQRADWTRARAVVAGRFVHGYSSKDLVLALIYRYNKLAIKVAGLGPLRVVGVENMDCSDLVTRHPDYCLRMRDILERVDLLGPSPPGNTVFTENSDEE